ncbi:hypothetical protein AGMMS50267_17290 [Spirochaetia bacterium]|nr:hypothetical protein AGMMS50267_17290 [Spirochaetia bacterium]
MQPIDHYFSILAGTERSLVTIDPQNVRLQSNSQAAREFSRLLAPIIGAEAAETLYSRTVTALAGQTPGTLAKLGYIAAFFLGVYEENTMTLDEQDWQEIRDTIEDASETMNLDTLTGLMDALLSTGHF